MIGSTLYLVGLDPVSKKLVPGTNFCAMCKRLIINAGSTTVNIRDTAEEFRVVNVNNWIEEDDSLTGESGY